MSSQEPRPEDRMTNPLFALLELSRRARRDSSLAELRFKLVNDSHALAPYRQGALWLADVALTGRIEAKRAEAAFIAEQLTRAHVLVREAGL